MDFRLTLEQEALKKKFDKYFREELKHAPLGWTVAIQTKPSSAMSAEIDWKWLARPYAVCISLVVTAMWYNQPHSDETGIQDEGRIPWIKTN